MAGVVSIAGAASGIAAPLTEGVPSAAYQPVAVPRRKLDALTALRFPASAFAVIGHTYSTFRFGVVFWAAFTLN